MFSQGLLVSRIIVMLLEVLVLENYVLADVQICSKRKALTE
jgi:hypothetical protein